MKKGKGFSGKVKDRMQDLYGIHGPKWTAILNDLIDDQRNGKISKNARLPADERPVKSYIEDWLRRESSTTAKENNQASSNYYKSPSLHFSVEYPRSWFANEFMDNYLVHMGDRSKNAWCYVHTYPHKTETIEQLETKSMLSHRNAFFFYVRSSDHDLWRNYPAFRIEYDIQLLKDLPMGRCRCLTILKNNLQYTLIFSAQTIDLFSKNESNFDLIANTFDIDSD